MRMVLNCSDSFQRKHQYLKLVEYHRNGKLIKASCSGLVKMTWTTIRCRYLRHLSMLKIKTCTKK